jgi:ornithine cyclodeaminase/alanine dehydrogenase-like protein (mu-crystallin family)
MQLETLANVYQVESASVFSPTAENRERFARQMSSKLGVKVRAAESAESAVRKCNVVVAATSSQSSEPVLRAAWLDRCRLLCAVGSTRPQSVEVDAACFGNAQAVVVDSARAGDEAGDLQQAVKTGVSSSESWITLAQLATDAVRLPTSGLVTFKSVGTGLQDLALATRYYELLRGRKDLPVAPDLASLKKPVSLKK